MKIQQIKFIEHQAFPVNSTLTFFNQSETNIPKIFFIVGNNGAGKTNILESLYYGLKNPHGYKIDKFNLGFELFIDSEYKSENSSKNGNSASLQSFSERTSIIYNSLNEVDFKNNQIKSTTATTTDDKVTPGDKSENLSTMIPQLLIDLKSDDNDSKSQWMDENPTKNSEACDIVKKFDRFKDAFEKMYGGSKKFKEIKKDSGEFKIIFEDEKGNEVDIKYFSTGEKQILYRVGDLLRNLNNLNGSIILIDEPETSLHPQRQQRYTQFILDIFHRLDVQIIIATHSPYILQGIKEGESVCIKLDKNNGGEIGQKIGYHPNTIKSPSINLINYLAYGIFDELLHIELYSALEIFSGIENQDKLTTWITTVNTTKNIMIQTRSFIASKSSPKFKVGDIVNELLPISIRNKLHHPGEKNRPNYNQKDLEDSINIMLKLLE